ncbi:MAG: hypothetical protein EHM24_02405 [Acidobacteria bacterium]|nr:MAG: hypothetical protein EHM24_15510 [Acidobacteriota bacterium]RPJ76368.1 MAG: hypothetical protein EHM24_02405 [Acidobacteriota bacterium]
MTRRSLLTGGVFTGLAGVSAAGAAIASAPAPEAPAPQSSRAEEAKVLEQIRDELRLQRGPCSPASCGVVDSIRAQQKTFLKNRGKFPDFIDIGIDVWESVYDWHVMARQKPEAGRMQDGRYGMNFMFTTLILRHDMTGNYIGIGYDGRGE